MFKFSIFINIIFYIILVVVVVVSNTTIPTKINAPLLLLSSTSSNNDIYININIGSDINGNGTIINPYQSLCKLNEINSISPTTIIKVYIAYGQYNNTKDTCVLQINNLNNISILPYSDKNNNIDLKIVNIKYIDLKIINSTINLNNIIFDVKRADYNDKILGEGLSITNSTVLFNNVEYNYNIEDSSYNFLILASNVSFINQSRLKLNDNCIFLDSIGIGVVDGSISISSSSSSSSTILFNNSTLIDTTFDINGNGAILKILNSRFYKTRNIISYFGIFSLTTNTTLELTNSTFDSKTGLTGSHFYFVNTLRSGSTVRVYDVIISGFEYFENIFSFIKNTNIHFEKVTFKNCKDSQFFGLSSSDIPYVFNDITLIDNEMFIFLILHGPTYQLNVSNIKSFCNHYTVSGSSPSFILFSGSFFSGSHSSRTPVNLHNIDLNCFGNSLFINASVKLDNLNVATTFSNDFFTIIESDVFINSANIRASDSNFYTSGLSSFLKLSGNGGSTLTITNSTLTNCQFIFLETGSLQRSTITISDTNFVGGQSNYRSFIIVTQSTLVINNCNFTKYSSHSSLIGASFSNITLHSTSITQSSFGISIIYADDCWSDFNHLNVQKCYTQIELFYFSFTSHLDDDYSFTTIGDGTEKCWTSSNLQTTISNSSFIDNIYIGGDGGVGDENYSTSNNHNIIETFYHDDDDNPYDLIYNWSNGTMIFSNKINLNIFGCNFSGNSFAYLIKSNSSSVNLEHITYGINAGSFYTSYCCQLLITDFHMDKIQLPVDYLMCLVSTDSILNGITINNSYFTQYLIYILGGTTEFNDFTFSDNTVTDSSIFGWPFPIPHPLNTEKPPNLIIVKQSEVYFNGFNIRGNILLSNLFSLQGSKLLFQFGDLSENRIQKNPSTIIESFCGSLYFFKTTINSNIATTYSNDDDTSCLISSYNAFLTIDSCEMSNNSFIEGAVANFVNKEYLCTDTPLFGWSSPPTNLSISNSIFNFNSASITGGVFFLATEFHNVPSISNFTNNSFSWNWGEWGGGAIYSSNYPFKVNLSTIYLENSFFKNQYFYGENDFSSSLKSIISIGDTSVYCTEPTTIEISFIDYFNITAKQLSGLYNFRIASSGFLEIVSCRAIDGTCSFVFSFNYTSGNSLSYKISSDDFINLDSFSINVIGCSSYKYIDNDKCFYCPIGSTTTPNQAIFNGHPCIKCNEEIQTCFESNVYAHDGYFLLNYTSHAFSCPIDMCYQNNSCPSKYYTGDLCFTCVDDSGSLVKAKNGIRCCNQFKPKLLIPILILIFFVLCFVLSSIVIAQQHCYTSPSLISSAIEESLFDNSIILFLQNNSVVYFSYSGIYFLPLFRLSIDVLDSFCLFKSLDYNGKVLVSYSIIILLTLIISMLSSIKYFKENIVLKPMIYYYSKILNKPNYTKQLLLNSKRNLNISGTTIEKRKRIQFYWSMLQILFIPIMFNSISILVSYKEFHEYFSYLMVDFSIIVYKSTLSKFLYIFSIIIICIIFLIILIVSIIILIITKSSKSSKSSKYNKNGNLVINITNYFLSLPILVGEIDDNSGRKKVGGNGIYKINFKLWYLVEMIKSTLFIVFSLTMIFNPINYMGIITSIQIVYSCLHFLLNPFNKGNYNQHFYKSNNLINLLQLSIFIISDSSIFKQIQYSNHKGIIISSLSFLALLFYIIFKSLNIK